MDRQRTPEQSVMSGRISESPSKLLHEEILEPQFTYELTYLLPAYLWIEKVLLLEYKRMGLLSQEEVFRIGQVLSTITADMLIAEPQANMSDICFAIEKLVRQQVNDEVYAWHVDRSRNDMQATAQVMFSREQLLLIVHELFTLLETVWKKASETIHIPMPGHTHYQAAQVISPGFYLSAVGEQIIEVLEGLLYVFDSLNQCPLGSGAMAGQELDWDRHQMAAWIGFTKPKRHALMAVASKDWMLQIGATLSQLSTPLSRFVTDLIQWGSGEYRYIDLPDHLSGISSAMPQKKNFPILERIRGRTAHLFTFFVDFTLTQRNTPYTNLVETGKEAGTYFLPLCQTMRSITKLLTTVMEHVTFNEERLKEACEKEYLGGFDLANHLTLHYHIPYRNAQVISGKFILQCMEQGLLPYQVDVQVLMDTAKSYGYEIEPTLDEIRALFKIEHMLSRKNAYGSSSPQQVSQLLDEQLEDWKRIRAEWDLRQKQILHAYEEVTTRIRG